MVSAGLTFTVSPGLLLLFIVIYWFSLPLLLLFASLDEFEFDESDL